MLVQRRICPSQVWNIAGLSWADAVGAWAGDEAHAVQSGWLADVVAVANVQVRGFARAADGCEAGEAGGLVGAVVV